MAISIEIEPEAGIAIATCSGALTRADAMAAASALWEDRRWPGRSAVWDFRSAQLDLSSADVRALADFILHHQRTPPPAKIAFVTPHDADFGMARMFDAFREDPATAFRVFRDYGEAMSWIGSAG